MVPPGSAVWLCGAPQNRTCDSTVRCVEADEATTEVSLICEICGEGRAKYRRQSGGLYDISRHNNNARAAAAPLFKSPLLNRYRFCQVSWLVYVAAAAYGDVVSQQLQRDNFNERRE